VADRLAADGSAAGGTANLIAAFTERGVTADTLARRIADAVGPDEMVVVRTGSDRAHVDEAEGEITAADTASLVGTLGGIAGFVAIFIVAGTFGLAVAQRHRELGLLRAVGATPPQVWRLITGEALVISMVASGIGAIAGTGLAYGLARALAALGLAPPSFPVWIGPVPYTVATGVGAGVSLLAALGAGWHAARIRPTEALRDAAVSRASITPGRIVGAVIALFMTLLMASVGMLLGGVLGIALAFPIALGLAAVVAPLVPLAVRPFVASAGAAIERVSRASGHLARRHAAANPRHLASVIAPVLLAATLTGGLLVVTTTWTRLTGAATAERLGADYILVAEPGEGLPASVAARAAQVPGVQAAVPVRSAQVGMPFFDDLISVPALVVGTTHPGDVFTLSWRSGSAPELAGNAVALSQTLAERRHWRRGQAVTLAMPDGRNAEVRVAAVFDGAPGFPDVLLPGTLADAHQATRVADEIYVRATPGAGTTLRADLSRLAGETPTVRVLDRAGYLHRLADRQVADEWSAWLIVGLGVLYAAIAIVNTSAMAIAGRRLDFAMLRLIGASRRQILRMVWWEALMAVLLGLALGSAIAVGTTLLLTVPATGRLYVAVPFAKYGAFMAGVAILGVTASLVTVRAALRAHPTEAIAGAK
jgi:putative ABC transport system permease protein